MRAAPLGLLAMALVGLSACASGPTPVALPDGSQGHSVSCDGNASSISDCMNSAAKFCGGRYAIVAQESGNAGGIIAPTGGLVIPISKRSLVFKCERP
jgi:hypothetical protein